MDRLEQFEKMLADLQAQYADTAARMEKLKAQDKGGGWPGRPAAPAPWAGPPPPCL